MVLPYTNLGYSASIYWYIYLVLRYNLNYYSYIVRKLGKNIEKQSKKLIYPKLVYLKYWRERTPNSQKHLGVGYYLEQWGECSQYINGLKKNGATHINKVYYSNYCNYNFLLQTIFKHVYNIPLELLIWGKEFSYRCIRYTIYIVSKQLFDFSDNFQRVARLQYINTKPLELPSIDGPLSCESSQNTVYTVYFQGHQRPKHLASAKRHLRAVPKSSSKLSSSS